MSQASILITPYERQADPLTNRMCGAAALHMIYQTFGVQITQADIAPRITRPDARGVAAARSHLLAAHALGSGLFALVFQAADPLAAMKACEGKPVRLILNHRLNVNLDAGHFTVLVGMEKEHAIIHDPHYGPSLRVLYHDLLKMWQPRRMPSEIAGNVIIAIGQAFLERMVCGLCGTQAPPLIPCPMCGKPIALHPAVALGCVAPGCPARTWKRIFCPACDASLSEVLDLQVKEAVIDPEDSAFAGVDRTWKQYKVGDRLNTLMTRLQQLPGGDGGWGAYLGRSMEQFQSALVKAREEERETRKKQAAQALQAAEPASGSEPLDGNQLGVDMLRTLGLLAPEPTPAPAPAPRKAPPARPKKPAPKLEFPKDGDAGDIFDTV